MAAASVGEIAACMVRVPAEVVKQRVQTGQYRSSLQALRSILRNEKGEGVFRGLYRGWATTVVREIPFTMIQFPLYEWMKARRAEYLKVERVTPIEGAVAGSIAGGIAAALTTPLDVIKTRIMLFHEHISFFSAAGSILRDEGPRAFFKGIGPRTMWISGGGAIFLGVYEFASDVCRKII
jgi:solute carrier family 25 S-adenosylmethionine transporter 26